MKEYRKGGHRKLKNTTKVTRKMRARIKSMFLVVGILMLISVWKIISIINADGDKYSKTVLDNQSYTTTNLASKRGEITDCNGTVLAYSEKVYNLIFDPKVILSDSDRYKEPTLNALTECFSELTRDQLEKVLFEKPNSSYEKLLKELPYSKIEAFVKKQEDTKNNPYIRGVWFEEGYIRKYPYSTLACHVLGFSSIVNGGELGIELQYNDELSGTDGVSYGYVDESLSVERVTKNPIDGYNIVTTLDYTVQNIIEKRIKEWNDEFGSKTTAVMVVDPNTGGILGMASSPSFDLNNPRNLTGIVDAETLKSYNDQQFMDKMYDVWKNYCVSQVFEPGSTMKTLTVATGLDEGLITPEDTFDCGGHEYVGGFTIHCHNRNGHGTLTLEGGLIQSCNPSMMQIARKLGVPLMSKYQVRYGFGKKTGIDLPGEENGLVISPDVMSETDLATNSFGQNISVTMVQMAAAYSAAVNGGYYYKPHIVKQVETSSGDIVKQNDAELVKQVISEETSEVLRGFLKNAVDIALARGTKVEDYSSAGKTGTAQKLPREDERYVISFIGHAPAENPKFVLYVLIDEPDREKCPIGSSTPVIKLSQIIMSDLLPYMNVFRDSDTGTPFDEISDDSDEVYAEGVITTGGAPAN